MCSRSIVSRRQTGKSLPSAEKQELIGREVVFHLGGLQLAFHEGRYDEDCIFNEDETHFVVDLTNGRTLAIKGDTNVNFCDVVSGDVGMNMMVMLGVV